jgi:omega-hydroxy-beta-dihydromenaquinone-9 sulfotransferase
LKSPANTGRLKEISELFPDARFIHIYRNPYEVFQSNERLYEKILPALAFHRVDEAALREYIFYFYEKIHKKYLADRAQIPASQLIEFSYEDFVADPMVAMRKTYDQLALGDFEKARGFLEKEIEATRSYQKNTYTQIDPQVRDRINGQWKFAFDAFGYEMMA